MVEDIIRDVIYALRTFKRAPLAVFTIVSTVALGLGLVAVAFTLLNALLFRVDEVPDVRAMFAVERPRTSDEGQPFTRTEFDALRRDTGVFTGVFAQVPDVDSRVDGRRMSGTFITGNAFQVLGVNAAIGRALAPADDQPSAGQAVMVLSHRGWDRLFGRDPAILGRSVLVKAVTFEIVGVMPEGFRGLAAGAPDDYWAPLSMLDDVRRLPRGAAAGAEGVAIIGRLKPGVSRQAAAAQLAAWDAAQVSANPKRALSSTEQPASITLVPKQGTVQQPVEAVLVTAPLFFSFGLILLISCANVANLLLARAVARQREIGIRLSLGAARRRIVRQLLTESLLLAVAAAAAALVISRVVLGVLINAMMTSWPPEIGDLRLLMPDADWRVLLFLAAGAAASTIAFGLAPALRATRIEPLRTIRGEVVRDARPSRARNFLIGLQVSASALLLISAGVFLRSAFAAATADPGIRIADTVAIPIANEATRAAMVQALSTEPSIAAIAASWPAAFAAPVTALAQSGGAAKATVAYKMVSPEIFSVLDIRVVRGRTFTPGERTPDLPVAVVSEATARALWPNADAVGQELRLDRDPSTGPAGGVEPRSDVRTFTVIGVVRDVAGFRIAPLKDAVVYLPANATMAGTAVIARVHGDPDRTGQTILNRLTTIDPAIEGVFPLRTITRMETYLLEVAFWLTIGLGGLALALTLSGLFSVLSYLVEQRKKEIGVHMALGATTRDVTRLVLSQAIWPVGAGLAAGAGLVATLARVLLATPAGALIGQIVQVFDPVAYAGSMLTIILACLIAASIPAIRAARLDPTVALRQE